MAAVHNSSLASKLSVFLSQRVDYVQGYLCYWWLKQLCWCFSFYCCVGHLPHVLYLDHSVYIFYYLILVATILIYHNTWWYQLYQHHFYSDFRFLCLVLRNLLNHPYCGLRFLQNCHLWQLFLLYQISLPAVSIHTFLMMSGLPVKVKI